jgi:hypothetical protein
VDWKAFQQAFVSENEAICQKITKHEKPSKTVLYWNFGTTMPADKVYAIFASEDPVIAFTSNRFVPPDGKPVHPKKFESVFRPTQALLALLPWGQREPPECVVHLRLGDNNGDKRAGLDSQTQTALKNELDASCFLITNHVEWYAPFELAGWSHPQWGTVKHELAGSLPSASTNNKHLEKWSDWYTIYKAKRVYHTQSGFSESAVYASGAFSRLILGTTKEGRLSLEKDHWSHPECAQNTSKPWNAEEFCTESY